MLLSVLRQTILFLLFSRYTACLCVPPCLIYITVFFGGQATDSKLQVGVLSDTLAAHSD